MRLLLFVIPLLLSITSALGSDEASDLPEDQIEEVLALYRKHCKPSYGGYDDGSSSGGYGSSSGGYGSSSGGYGAPPRPKVNIVCKEGRENYEAPRKQIIRIPAEKPRKNIVFAVAPTLKLKHEINLVSNEGQKPSRTVIYVLPQKANHQLKLWDKRPSQGPSKPQVFFLKNDKSHASVPVQQTPLPAYGVPIPTQQPQPIYGVPTPEPQQIYGPPQPVVVTTPQPAYGVPSYEPVTTFRPNVVNYGFPSQIFQQNPSQIQQIQFDPNSLGLGPEYEIIRADPGTQNAYQNLFVQQQAASIPQPQFRFVDSSIEGQAGDDSPSNGRVIFPSESIQNYKIQAFPGQKSLGVKPSSNEDDELTDAQAEKSIRAIIAAYENRKRTEEATTTEPTTTTTSTTTTSTTTEASTTTTPKPTTSAEPRRVFRLNTNLFDGSFVRTLISNANARSTATSSPNRSRIVLRYFNPEPNRPLTSSPIVSNDDNTPIITASVPERELVTSSSTNAKRSVEKPGFEIFPAQFVSYSYSKVDRAR